MVLVSADTTMDLCKLADRAHQVMEVIIPTVSAIADIFTDAIGISETP